MTKPARRNLVRLVASSALVLALAVGVEYQWDFFSASGVGALTAQVPGVATPAGGPGLGSSGAGAPPEEPLPAQIFSDVSSGHQHARAIYELKLREIMQGRDDGSFRPDQTLNKVETLVVSMRAAGIPNDPNSPAAPLRDNQNLNQWYYSWVNTAYNLGIIKGDKDNRFQPDKATNVAEFLVMMSGALQLDLAAYQAGEGQPWYQTYQNFYEDNGRAVLEVDGLPFFADNLGLPITEVQRAKGAQLLWNIMVGYDLACSQAGWCK